MTNISLGDLVSLQNHPYRRGTQDVQIAGYAGMTPPILVISEILNPPKEHDTETGIAKSKQVKGIYYCHKNHKFETLWLNIKELKLIRKSFVAEASRDNGDEKTNDDEIKTKEVIFQKYPKSISLEEIREQFLHKQVILKSCDLELGKKKLTFIQNDKKPSNKVTAHLDFLPPVLTVIDVKRNDDKVLYNPKSGNLKKISSIYLLKCKWYNPFSGSFSEEFVPIETVKLLLEEDLSPVIEAINNKQIFSLKTGENILKESQKSLKHVYIQPLEIIFNHYKYEVKYYDIFRNRFTKINLSDFILGEDKMRMDDLVIDMFPKYDKNVGDYTKIKDFQFKINQFYRINYRDLNGIVTNRIIYLKEYIPNKVLIADCLLRNGEERHFRLDENALLKLEVLNQNLFI